jgi:alkanesulfonate monooxygenase SsuD/methylene tetrahydromethanopterin reductase-like flavin-dependent oxidoreductase (luciferase family)
VRFGLCQEADAPGISFRQRYLEMVEEAQFAEEMGFDFYALSEQHFNPTVASVSAPETILPFVAARTSRINLRWTSVVLLAFNHPIRVTERLTTLDVISRGRAQLGTARSNNLRTLRVFGIEPGETRRQWEESLDVIRTVLTEQPFEFHGQIWNIPPTYLEPLPYQQPHPPIFVSATSLETHGNAGRKGIGVMTGNSLPGGWEYMEEAVATYRAALTEHEPVKGAVTDSASALAVMAHCAETDEQAKAESEQAAFRFVHEIIGWFQALSKSSPDYAYLSRIEEIVDRKDDLDFLIDRAPYLTIGSPQFFIDRAKRLQALGYDEFILRIDGMTHEHHMKAIELIGKYVIPEVKSPPPREPVQT